MNERAAAPVAITVVLGVTLLLFAPLFVGLATGHPRFFEWDVPEQYWPDLVYLCRSLHAGTLPYWNPYDHGGYPYYADPQASQYHPLAWGICAVAGASPGLGWQEARVVIGFLCAGLFGLLWLRRLGTSWAGAAVGATVIESAPFMRHNWELNLTSALGFLPLVLWALERLFATRSWRDAALVALAEALLVWTGSPPAAWFAGSFTALYVVGRLIEVARANGRSSLVTLAPRLALAAVLVCGLCAVVLVPGLTLAHYSVQAGRSYASLAEGGIPLDQLAALVWPHDGNHLYVGWIALALAPLAWWKRERLPGRTVLAIAAVVAVLLALGDHGPLFRLAFHVVPGVRMFRLPHRYEAWLGPAMGALAAAGLDALREKLGSRRIAWPFVSAALSLLLLFDVSRHMPPDRHTRAGTPPGSDTLVLSRDLTWRYFDEFGIGCRSGTRLARRDLRGYQDPLLLHSYERMMSSLSEHPLLVAQFNVRYVLSSPHFLHGWDHHYLPRPAVLLSLPGTRDRGHGVIEFESALPLAYFVRDEDVEHTTTREEALARTIERAPSASAILVGARSLHSPSSPPILPARLISYGTDALALRVDAPSSGVLVVNETWYPGWRAMVDERETPIQLANGLVRAVAVPAGHHVVAMRFAPPDGPPLRWLLLASWVAVIALWIPWRRRDRR